MSKTKLIRDKSIAILSIAISVAAYAVERLIEIFCEPSRALSFGLAFSMTLCLGAVCFLLLKNKNVFMGLLASLIGYKMLPPTISMISSTSLYGEELYYLVRCAAALIFIALIVKFYRLQKGEERIKTLPILAIMLSTPFFTKIATDSYSFVMVKTGNMLYYYFLTFACYIVGSLVILAIAYRANYASMRFAAYFEFIALGINALKRIGAIVATVSAGDHISRSYYCWIAIYAVLALGFWLAKEKKRKEIK